MPEPTPFEQIGDSLRRRAERTRPQEELSGEEEDALPRWGLVALTASTLLLFVVIAASLRDAGWI